jgi:hypothetical protein
MLLARIHSRAGRTAAPPTGGPGAAAGGITPGSATLEKGLFVAADFRFDPIVSSGAVTRGPTRARFPRKAGESRHPWRCSSPNQSRAAPELLDPAEKRSLPRATRDLRVLDLRSSDTSGGKEIGETTIAPDVSVTRDRRLPALRPIPPVSRTPSVRAVSVLEPFDVVRVVVAGAPASDCDRVAALPRRRSTRTRVPWGLVRARGARAALHFGLQRYGCRPPLPGDITTGLDRNLSRLVPAGRSCLSPAGLEPGFPA